MTKKESIKQVIDDLKCNLEEKLEDFQINAFKNILNSFYDDIYAECYWQYNSYLNGDLQRVYNNSLKAVDHYNKIIETFKKLDKKNDK